jgi:hypothetical protein
MIFGIKYSLTNMKSKEDINFPPLHQNVAYITTTMTGL